MRVIKLIFSMLFLSIQQSCLAQSGIVLTKDLSDSVPVNSIILFGEQHVGKQRKVIHQEWFEICNKNNIDTVFIEQPYSVYLNAKIDFGMDYMDMEPFTDSEKTVLIPVDIEDDFSEAVLAISAVLGVNNLDGSYYDLENNLFYSEFRSTKTFNSKKFLEFVGDLQKDVLPKLKNYQPEFGKLLEMLNKTYVVFPPEKLSKAYYTRERDSLMAEQIEGYVTKHHVTRWAGLFGSFHIYHPNDLMYDSKSDLYKNMYSQLIDHGVIFKNEQYPLRIIYKSLSAIFRPDSMISSNFTNRYEDDYSSLNKRNIILDKRERTMFWITKK